MLISFLQFSCNSEGITNNAPTTNPVDVYVAGSKDGQACYWKNGQVVMLDSGNFNSSNVIKIIVSNNNVYAFGGGTITNVKGYSLFWKNGVLHNLEVELNTENYSYISIRDMEIYNDNVYFLGSYYINPGIASIAFWKNGVKNIIGSGSTDYQNPSFKVYNNDVFVSVYIANVGNDGYFKNSVYYTLPNSYINGFAVNNNDVYTYGRNSNDGFYLNTSTNLNNTISFPANNDITNLSFDNGNIYYSTFDEIYKNSSLINSVANPTTEEVIDFEVLNNNVYNLKLEKTQNGYEQKTYLNNIEIQSALQGENFVTLFIVQN